MYSKYSDTYQIRIIYKQSTCHINISVFSKIIKLSTNLYLTPNNILKYFLLKHFLILIPIICFT